MLPMLPNVTKDVTKLSLIATKTYNNVTNVTNFFTLPKRIENIF